MKLTTVSVAVAALFVFAQSAEAREYRHHHAAGRQAWSHHRAQHYSSRGRGGNTEQEGYADFGQSFGFSSQSAGGYQPASRLGGRPAAWCGWEMRQLVGSDPGPSYNLARNWAHWGQPGPAGIGAVVVWAHHVGKIVGQQNGQWIVQSGNDGHALRTRPLSVAGAIAFRWG
jgi:hypothetical protein